MLSPQIRLIYFVAEDRQQALLFYQYGLGAVLCALICAVNGELTAGIQMLQESSLFALLNMLGFMCGSYAGMHPMMKLTQQFDATSTQVVTSLRKILTFASSFLFFPKPFTYLHMFGVCAAMAGAWQLQSQRAGAKALSETSAQTETKKKEVSV